MVNLNKAILFLILVQLKIVAYGQLNNTNQVKLTAGIPQQSISAIRVNDIPSTITAPPNISYSTPPIYGINVPITPLIPNNTGGSIPAANYGQQTVFAGPGPLQYVTGLVAEPDGSLYIANYGDNTVYKVSAAGVISVFAGPSGAGYSFALPDALVADAAGNIYVSDMGNNLIRKITPAGQVSTFAGSGNVGSADNTTGLLASFNAPRGMTRDAAGNIYLADQVNNLIRKISPAGAVTTVAGRAGVGFTNGNVATATFNTPTAVGIDNAGNLYVADTQNGAIRKIATDGTVSTVATGLNTPRELRVDGTGNIYFVEQGSGRLLRIATNGTVSTIATGFNGPIGLVLDGKGNLYVGAFSLIHKVVISGYTIDKALPTGLSFDRQTGTISGKPTIIWPATNYTITAYNGGGSHSTNVSIAVDANVKKPSVIHLPTQNPDVIDANNNYDPGGTSNNAETPITYTSSNPAVATVTANGLIHLTGPGVTTITARQSGNANYADATPVDQILTVYEHLYVNLPSFQTKTVCSADFSANAFIGDGAIPVSYTSSNPNVATISSQGIIHINGAGSTVITISQNTSQQYYISAEPKSQTLTVILPDVPDVAITPAYDSPCKGGLITFTAAGHNGGANPTYQWRVNNTVVPDNNTFIFASATLNNGDNVTCTLVNNDSPCLTGFPANSNGITVNLISPITPSVTITASTNYVFPGTKIAFTADVKNGSGADTYQWYVNGATAGNNSAKFESSELADGDLVMCVILANNVCSLPAESPAIKVNLVSRIEIPNTFTPNADGINDTWFIKGLASYPDCLVCIYNRQGQLLYRSKGYSAQWDGRLNGKDVPPSTYYYVIDLHFQNKVMSGYITLIK